MAKRHPGLSKDGSAIPADRSSSRPAAPPSTMPDPRPAPPASYPLFCPDSAPSPALPADPAPHDPRVPTRGFARHARAHPPRLLPPPFQARNISCQNVTHAFANGNNSRKFHTHVVSTHLDIRRVPETGQWDFGARDTLRPFTNSARSLLATPAILTAAQCGTSVRPALPGSTTESWSPYLQYRHRKWNHAPRSRLAPRPPAPPSRRFSHPAGPGHCVPPHSFRLPQATRPPRLPTSRSSLATSFTRLPKLHPTSTGFQQTCFQAPRPQKNHRHSISSAF